MTPIQQHFVYHLTYHLATPHDISRIAEITGRSDRWINSALPYLTLASIEVNNTNKIVGCCCIAPYYNTKNLTPYTYDDVKGKAVSLLAELSVDSEYRRMYIGRNLLNFAMSRLNKPYIVAQVRCSNEALEFYFKNGFHAVFTVPHYYSDGENAVYLVREYN